MSTTTPFTPAQEERFAVLCAWCANGCNAHKDEQGQYVHFPDGRVKCEASKARLELEKSPMDRMKEVWQSDKCPIDGNLKMARKYFFCKGCTWSLPREIQNALKYRPERAFPEWMRAMAILKERRDGAK